MRQLALVVEARCTKSAAPTGARRERPRESGLQFKVALLKFERRLPPAAPAEASEPRPNVPRDRGARATGGAGRALISARLHAGGDRRVAAGHAAYGLRLAEAAGFRASVSAGVGASIARRSFAFLRPILHPRRRDRAATGATARVTRRRSGSSSSRSTRRRDRIIVSSHHLPYCGCVLDATCWVARPALRPADRPRLCGRSSGQLRLVTTLRVLEEAERNIHRAFDPAALLRFTPGSVCLWKWSIRSTRRTGPVAGGHG